MEQLYFVENGRRRKAQKVKCANCEKDFLCRKNQKRKYCSVSCKNVGSRNRIEVECFNCGKKIQKVSSKLKNSKHGFYFCGRKCKEEAQSLKGKCPEIRPEHYGTSEGRESYRNLIKNSFNPICCGCGEKTIYLLQVHHIDGNRSNNNDESNFEIVCNNCHVKRHLYLKEGEWYFWTQALTPRDMLDKL